MSAERGRNVDDDERYLLSPLARKYIQKFIRPTIDEQKRLLKRQNVLRSAQEEFSAKAGADVFSMTTVYVRDKDDYIVASILTRAIERIFRGELGDAEAELNRAAGLSPNYFEVYRVEALLRIAEGDFFRAEAAYEAAISLAPDRAPLRLWYGGFLSRELGDQDRALEHLLKAEELAPGSALVKLECARVFQYLRRFDEADLRLSAISELEKLPSKTRRMHLDLSIQNLLRKADHFAGQEEFLRALECLEEARATLGKAPRSLVDQRTEHNVTRAKRQLPNLIRAFTGLPEQVRVASIMDWLNHPTNSIWRRTIVAPSDQDAKPITKRGCLSNLHANYGFVVTDSERLFFHRGSWIGQPDFIALGEGSEVEYDIGSNDRGICAINVRPVGVNVFDNSNELLVGTVRKKDKTFGFISTELGDSVFFHRSKCADGTKFQTLKIGERVRFALGKDLDGRVCALNVERYSGLQP